MQMCIYVGWLTHAVNTTEFIWLKLWVWHSHQCDLTYKRFTNKVSEMVIPPKGPAVLLTTLDHVFPPVPLAGNPLSIHQTYWIFYRHITQIPNQICLLIWNGCRLCDLVCSANWIVLLWALVPSEECWYLWAPACSTETLGSWFPGDQFSF